MKKKGHINLRALAMAFLLFFAFTAKEMHNFVEHHDHEVKICDAKNGEKHLHDHEYIHDECPLCDFTFSIFEFSLPHFELKPPINVYEKSIFSYYDQVSSQKHFFKPLRGPPALI